MEMFGNSQVRGVEGRGGAGRAQDLGGCCNELPKVSLPLLSNASTLREMAPPPVTYVSWDLTRKCGRQQAAGSVSRSCALKLRLPEGRGLLTVCACVLRRPGAGAASPGGLNPGALCPREARAGARARRGPLLSSSLHLPSDHDRYVVPVRYSLSAPPCAPLWRRAGPRTTGIPGCPLPPSGANCQRQRGGVRAPGCPRGCGSLWVRLSAPRAPLV